MLSISDQNSADEVINGPQTESPAIHTHSSSSIQREKPRLEKGEGGLSRSRSPWGALTCGPSLA